jgi:uncharacterized protein YbjT (DUF2867 family)
MMMSLLYHDTRAARVCRLPFVEDDMRVFLTGASGFIGSAIIPELQAAGHEVLGLARSDDNAARLRAAGVAIHRGDLNDPEALAAGAAATDATIHCAFIHDFSRFA